MTPDTPQPERRQPAPAWPVDARDPESAVLAERWEAFGRLLERTTPVVDSAALEAALRRRLAPRPRRAETSRWLAVAAAVLVLVGLAWSLTRTGSLGPAAPPRIAQQAAPPAAAETPSQVVEAVEAVVPWTDEFDDELTNFRADAEAVESAWRQPFDAAAGLRWQIERVDGEWSETSL